MTPRGFLNPTGLQWRISRGLAVAMLVVAGLVISAVARAQDPCGAHFARLRAVVAATGPNRPVPAAEKAALVEELAIERVLWDDEVARQRQRLGTVDPKVARIAIERLDRIAADVNLVLTALGHSLDTDTALDTAVTDRALACAGNGSLVPRWPTASAAPSPLPPLPRRTPAPGQPAPAGYFEPPAGPGAGALAGERAIAPLQLAATNEDEEPADPVTAKATELGNDPVAIYGFVRDSIRAEHYHGGAKSPATVLASGSGNDADQSGLLAALLRAAGFPARLVWGVVELPQAALLGHFAVTDPTALEQAMTSAGIPWTPVVVGGQPVAYRVERVWAEVWLPFANFRGVLLDRSGTTWVPLDPELKSHLPGTTRRVFDEMTLDAVGLRTEFLSGGLCGGDLTLPDACPAFRDVLVGRVDQYLQDHGDTERWDSLAVPPRVPTRDEPILPATLPGSIVAVHGWGLDLPESLTHRISFTAQAAGVTLLEATLPVAALAGRGTVVWYAPATPDDATIVEAYGGYLWDVPPYLLNVTPVITVGSEELARGSAGVGMGRPFDLATLLTTPGGQTTSFTNTALAGVPVGIGIAPGRQGYAPAGSEPVNTVEMLSVLATEYLDQTDTFRNELAAVDGLTVVHPYPSVAAVASVVEVQGSLGIVTGLAWQGVVLDADLDGSEITGRTAAARARWRILEGLQASTLERRIFESREITGVTADKALMLANLGGTPIVHITRDNLQTALDTLSYDANIEAEIATWVLGGGEAEIPEAPQALLAWQGVGYLLTDPATGQARYQLAGALSGGMTAVPPDLFPWGDLVWEPSEGDVNPDPTAATAIRILDGNLQQAEVDEILSTAETKHHDLRVLVEDAQGRAVRNAPVTFVVAGGGGALIPEAGQVVSNARGVATVQYRMGRYTKDSPYFVTLRPSDRFATQCLLNTITASVNGVPLSQPFYEIATPQGVASLTTPFGTSHSGLPNTSVGTPLVVVPVDTFSNPISNLSVHYALEGSAPPADLTRGPALLDTANVCRQGQLIGQECPGSGATLDLVGGVTGVGAVLILGDGGAGPTTVVRATATNSAGGTVEVVFNGVLDTTQVPGGASVGTPAVMVSGRGQPVSVVDGNTHIVEAYAPGTAAYPLSATILLVRQDYDVEPCAGDEDHFCTRPRGTFTTMRLISGTARQTCRIPDEPETGCGTGGLQERATVVYTAHVNGEDTDTEVSASDPQGLFLLPYTLPAEPAMVNVMAHASEVLARRPKHPAVPVYPSEIVPCRNAGTVCGAELEVVSIPIEQVPQATFTLWSVLAQAVEPTPTVVLSAARASKPGGGTEDYVYLEQPLAIPYTLKPDTYKASNVAILFQEAGLPVLVAEVPGRGPGAATLPRGRGFASPAAVHTLQVVVNHGYAWASPPDPGKPPTLGTEVTAPTQPLPVLLFDLDIDSDNTDGDQPPGQSEYEDLVERGEGSSVDERFGKLVPVNRGDADSDGRPDYADLALTTNASTGLVPVVLHLGVLPPESDWSKVHVTFSYSGPESDEAVPRDEDYEGTDLKREGYKDYTKAQTNKGPLRLWRATSPSASRTTADFIRPGHPYSAEELEFNAGASTASFMLEGVEDKQVAPFITAGVNVENWPQQVDAVRVTLIAGDLGLNNSNSHHSAEGVYSTMRAGVSDAAWEINDDDEMVEDQGDGFLFWRSTSSSLIPLPTGGLVDSFPLLVKAPAAVHDASLRFSLSIKPNDMRIPLRVFRALPGAAADRLAFLKTTEDADDQVALARSGVVGIVEGDQDFIDVEPGDNELVAYSPTAIWRTGTEVFRLMLWAEKPGSSKRVLLDSAKVTLRPLSDLYWTGTMRDSLEQPVPFPIDDRNSVELQSYGNARYEAGPSPEPPSVRSDTVVFVHGYNVDNLAAEVSAGIVFRRLFWLGYRGNFAAIRWHGDEGPIWAFGWAVENAFGTSPGMREFFKSAASINIDSTKTTVIAHSLGNQVVLDALRIEGWEFPGSKLFRSLVSVETAIWPETFWNHADFTYTGIVPVTYTAAQLQKNSWCFWYNQPEYPALDAVVSAFHSFTPDDDVLALMRYDDFIKRNRSKHFTRFEDVIDEIGNRVPAAGLGSPPGKDLAYIPTMFRQGKRNLTEFSTWTDLMLPLGTEANPKVDSDKNMRANDFGATDDAHSAFKDDPLPQVWDWWQWLFVNNAVRRDCEKCGD